MRDTLSKDITEVIHKQSKLKAVYDDTCIELRHRSDQLKDCQVKTDNMTAKFRFNHDTLESEKQKNITDNFNRTNHLNELKRDNIT
jgi:hypothetical protein